MNSLPILFDRRVIHNRICELACEIDRDYADQHVLFVGIMLGALHFMSELMREVRMVASSNYCYVDINTRPRLSAVSSYVPMHGLHGTISSDYFPQQVETAHVILVEDIVDTGKTLTYVQRAILTCLPASLKTAVLLDKVAARQMPVPLDYIGFQCPNKFVVGFGMDCLGAHRNERDICYMPEDK